MRDSAGDARRRLTLAWRLYDEGRAEDAAAVAETALAVLDRVLPPNHPDTALACVELSVLHERLSQYDRAERYARRSNVITEMYPRTEENLVRTRVQALGRLAAVERLRGRLGGAEVLFRAALELVENASWPAVSEVVELMDGLAVVHRAAGRLAESEALSRQALAVLDRHDLTAAPLWANLGQVERIRGNFAAGEPYARRALRLRVEALGQNHASVADERVGLAGLLTGQGEFAEAESHYLGALATYDRVFPPDHFERAVACDDFGVLLAASGRVGAAGRMFRRAIEIKRRLLGRDHPQVAVTLEHIARLR